MRKAEQRISSATDGAISEPGSSLFESLPESVQDLRDEYVRHFQNQDFVVGRQYEAQLSKTLLPKITAADLQKLADRFKPSSSCTVKAISHKRHVLLVAALHIITASVHAVTYCLHSIEHARNIFAHRRWKQIKFIQRFSYHR